MLKTRDEALQVYLDLINAAEKTDLAADKPYAVREVKRELCLNDLFYLLVFALHRRDINRNWLYDRCREVQENPDGYLDLWAREHYKSTIITFGKTIQDILRNSELTFGFFSHTQSISSKFLAQIKREFEDNDELKELFSDVLWENPKRDAPSWSVQNGIIVRRKSNAKEATVEAWGLVDNQPTSMHFSVLVYDDVVTDKSVYTPEMLEKTLKAFELSLNLGADGGVIRGIGTRYHFNDAYRTIMERGTLIPRIKPATVDGKEGGEPVFLTREKLQKKRRDFGPYTFGCQMLQNPVADNVMGFKEEWLRFYNYTDHRGWNTYILVDAASKKKKGSDYTVMWVWGLSPDGNYYLLDAVRDRLNLTEKVNALFALHQRWTPRAVGYEEYGAMADIEHIQSVMDAKNYRFDIVPLGGRMPKEDRIRRLVPIFEAGRVFLPYHLHYVDITGVQHDLVHEFRNQEFAAFPVSTHDDMLDAASRIMDQNFDARHPRHASAMVGRMVANNKGYKVLNV